MVREVNVSKAVRISIIIIIIIFVSFVISDFILNNLFKLSERMSRIIGFSISYLAAFIFFAYFYNRSGKSSEEDSES